MTDPAQPRLYAEPDPDEPGWLRWTATDTGHFNDMVLGRQLVRQEGANICRHRMFPEQRHTNFAGAIHGATLLSLADVALFSTLAQLSDVNPTNSVTLDLQMQFIAPGDPSQPLDAVVELLRETRRFAFMQARIVQGERLVAAFSGKIKK